MSNRIAIMQPHFFPYLGYFSLIENTDFFIFFDTPQFKNKGWMNRVKILNQHGESTYITVPIMNHKRDTCINEITISNNTNWKDSVYGKLSVYRRKAPHYEKVLGIVEETFDNCEGNMISDLDIESIKAVCNYLKMDFKYQKYSKMSIEIEEVNNPDEWALNICKALGIKEYVNLPGGQKFFDRNKYFDNGVSLEFIQNNLKPYVQKTGIFCPGLSILDALMFCEIEQVLLMVEDYKIF